MADVVQLVNHGGSTLLFDLLPYLAPDGLDLGTPERKVAVAQTFVTPGAYVGDTILGLRTITLTLNIVEATQDDVGNTWLELAGVMDSNPDLEIDLGMSSGGSEFFDCLPGVFTPEFPPSWWRNAVMRGQIQMQAQPYCRSGNLL